MKNKQIVGALPTALRRHSPPQFVRTLNEWAVLLQPIVLVAGALLTASWAIFTFSASATTSKAQTELAIKQLELADLQYQHSRGEVLVADMLIQRVGPPDSQGRRFVSIRFNVRNEGLADATLQTNKAYCEMRRKLDELDANKNIQWEQPIRSYLPAGGFTPAALQRKGGGIFIDTLFWLAKGGLYEVRCAASQEGPEELVRLDHLWVD
ncbi:MAG: hypothetical protein JST92_11210 [Deltaproteobacteria bacterium]|nr:hypothetical protein [Deltaproteobacteria bacterium]